MTAPVCAACARPCAIVIFAWKTTIGSSPSSGRRPSSGPSVSGSSLSLSAHATSNELDAMNIVSSLELIMAGLSLPAGGSSRDRSHEKTRSLGFAHDARPGLQRLAKREHFGEQVTVACEALAHTVRHDRRDVVELAPCERR